MALIYPIQIRGVNRGEDSYFAAHRFLDSEGVPTSSANVDQITQFIDQQVGGVTLGDSGGGGGGGYTDPLSGGGAYVPGSSGGGGSNDTGVTDQQFAMGTPFGGGYRPPAAGNSLLLPIVACNHA